MNAWFITSLAAFLLHASNSCYTWLRDLTLRETTRRNNFKHNTYYNKNLPKITISKSSPIDIVTTNAQANANLTSFTFTGYDDNTVLTEIKNTVKFTLDHQKMHVDGGDLPGQFVRLYIKVAHTCQIFHKCIIYLWVLCPAVFFFFFFFTTPALLIASVKRTAQMPFLLQFSGDKACITQYISMDDLLPGVDRTKYYRYLGSLTTPNKFTELIDMFSTSVYINKATNSPQMVNMFRGVQLVNSRIVTSQVAGTKATGPVSQTVFDLDVLDPSSDCQTPEPYTFD
uniref:Carbonic anhydrase XVb n=1 Tax=Cyprinus carpio TaxID=7962 RepID=A0A8C1Y0M1_CYPCA